MNGNVERPAIILGLGNDILTDDGVGIHAARRATELLLEEDTPKEQIQVCEACIAGVALLDILSGFTRAVIIDAAIDPSSSAGSINVSTIEEYTSTHHLVAAHQIDLPTAVLLGKEIGEDLPSEIFVVAVVAEDITSFSMKCTPKVDAAIENAARLAIRIARTGSAP